MDHFFPVCYDFIESEESEAGEEELHDEDEHLPDFYFGVSEDEEDSDDDDSLHQDMGNPPNSPRGHVHAECTFCLENVTEGDEGGNVTILVCGHTFHNTCMNRWLLVKPQGECPICKRPVEGAINL